MTGERLYGLDWLRIAAFGLLIFYHIGMFFVSWDWHIKTPDILRWVEVPMMALSPWRLSLLFLISGTASAFLLAKLGRPGAFAASRTARLLVPLIAGMAVFVAPQPWVELIVQHGYTKGFWEFWTHDYFRFGKLEGLDLPTWNHLWFVAYLWVYTMVLAMAASVMPGGALVRAGERMLAGPLLLIVPIVMLWVLRMTLYPVFGETHGLSDDWYNHAAYGLMFVIGLLIAHSPALRDGFRAYRRLALVLAMIGYAGIIAFRLAYPEDDADAVTIGFARLARTFESWGAIVALVGFALSWNVADSPARRYLTEAVFPYYIAHQTLIVLIAFWLRPFGLGNGAMFALLVAGTSAGCALSYELARRSGPLRPLFGLKRKGLENHSQSQRAVAH